MTRFIKALSIVALGVAVSAPIGDAVASSAVSQSYGQGFEGRWVPVSNYNYGRQIDRPMRVFIEFDSLRDLAQDERRGRRARRAENRRDRQTIDRREAAVLNTVIANMNQGVRLVETPRAADLIIRAIPRDYNTRFRVTDVNQKVKKAKRGRRAGYRFDRVTERARLTYDYDIVVRVPGAGRIEKRVTGRVRDSFTYGANLNRYGYGANFRNAAYPNDRVANLFARNTPEFRKGIVRSLKREAEQEIGFKLAQIINLQAADYYAPAVIVDEPLYERPRRNRGRINAGEAVGLGIAAGVLTILLADAID